MKRLIALAMASVMMFSASVVCFAADNTTPAEVAEGSKSPTAEEIMETIEELSKRIEDLTRAVNAKQTIVVNNGGSSSSGGGGRSSSPAATTNNVVSYGSNIVYQGGKIEINGGRSNVTFTITAPNGGAMTSATSLAAQVGGSLVNCINTSSPGVNFANAKVNFFVSGVEAGDNIAVYQSQNGTWVQLPVAEIRKDHVVVNLTRHGTIAFVRVPVLATITN